MSVDAVKCLLRNLKAKKSRLLALQNYINECYALMSGVSAVDYSKTPTRGNAANATENRYISHADHLARIQKMYDELFDAMCAEEDKLAECMHTLSPTEYEVILNRYMRGISVRKTANIMGYSEEGIFKIQQKAFKKISKEVDEKK